MSAPKSKHGAPGYSRYSATAARRWSKAEASLVGVPRSERPLTEAEIAEARSRANDAIVETAATVAEWDRTKTRPAGGDYWACCPFHAEKSASFHVLKHKGRFNCFGCGAKGDGLALVQALEHCSFRVAAEKFLNGDRIEPSPELLALREEQEREREADEARERAHAKAAAEALYFGAGGHVAGTLGQLYYRHARNIRAPLASADLRFHPRAPWFPMLPDWKHSQRGPAIVAAVRHIERGHVATHASYLREDGRGLADIPRCEKGRKIIGRDWLGGFVRLGPVRDAVVVAEGIETAFSASEAIKLPGVATLTAGGMRELLLPQSVRRVVIAYDRDASGVGEIAATVLADRLTDEGRAVEMLPPPEGCGDWNDHAKAQRVNAEAAA